MRQVRSFGSAKAFFWDKDALLARLRDIAGEALARFPEIIEVRLIGSLAKGSETGLSDIDLFVRLSDSAEANPLERTKPYYHFFADKLELALDMIVAVGEHDHEEILQGSVLLATRAHGHEP